jgi:hypothetical protein
LTSVEKSSQVATAAGLLTLNTRMLPVFSSTNQREASPGACRTSPCAWATA